MKVAVFAFLCVCSVVDAAYQELPPPPVIQYRPKTEANRTTIATDIHKEMQDLDNQIQKLYQDKSNIQVKAESATQLANSLLDQYHQQVELAQQYQQQMQSVDDKIGNLVRKKADLSKELRK